MIHRPQALLLLVVALNFRPSRAFASLSVPRRAIGSSTSRFTSHHSMLLPTFSRQGRVFATSYFCRTPQRSRSRLYWQRRTCSRRAMSSTSSFDDHDHSLDQLQSRMQAFVNQHSGRLQFTLALAGGGSHFLSTLTSTPGASSVFLEGTVTYDRESFKDYVEPQSLESNESTRKSYHHSFSSCDSISSDVFRYASHEASELLGSAALRRALYLTARGVGNDDDKTPQVLSSMTQTMGVAMTSKLRSHASGTSRAFAIVTRHDGPPVTVEATLRGTGDKDAAESRDSHPPRTRLQEDIFISHVLLSCLEDALADEKRPVRSFTTQMGDVLEYRVPPKVDPDQAVVDAINRVLLHDEPSVMLIPDTLGKTSRWQPLATTVLPPNSLIVSGSFNPPHHGHVGLAEAALNATECPVVWFELALTNADKHNEWTADKVLERLSGFGLLPQLQSNPFPWGIILTNKAPLFVDKAYLLDPLQAKKRNGSPQHLHFVIGTDTLVRMVDPKYYGDSRQAMIDSLTRMPCRFVVGGRLKQSKDPVNDSPPEFVTGQEEVDSLPLELQGKFTLLPDFRMDISSTELRKKMAEKH